MTYSPRLYNGQLYALLSATDELVKIDINTGSYNVVSKHNGFVRGMTLLDDHLFTGLYYLRKPTPLAVRKWRNVWSCLWF